MFKKFEYMLNAILYSLYCGRVHSIKRQTKIVYKTFLSALRMPFLSRWKNQLGPLIAKNMKASESNLYNKRGSTSIGMAIRMFGYFYSGYPSLVSLVLAGASIRVLHKFDLLVVVLAIGIPIGICYIPAYKAVFSNDRYLRYFQQFERERMKLGTKSGSERRFSFVWDQLSLHYWAWLQHSPLLSYYR